MLLPGTSTGALKRCNCHGSSGRTSSATFTVRVSSYAQRMHKLLVAEPKHAVDPGSGVASRTSGSHTPNHGDIALGDLRSNAGLALMCNFAGVFLKAFTVSNVAQDSRIASDMVLVGLVVVRRMPAHRQNADSNCLTSLKLARVSSLSFLLKVRMACSKLRSVCHSPKYGQPRFSGPCRRRGLSLGTALVVRPSPLLGGQFARRAWGWCAGVDV